MRILAWLLLTPSLTLFAADPVIVSAADPTIGVTANSLATMFGDHLASVTEAAKGLPWPESLGDLSVVSITTPPNTSRLRGCYMFRPRK